MVMNDIAFTKKEKKNDFVFDFLIYPFIFISKSTTAPTQEEKRTKSYRSRIFGSK